MDVRKATFLFGRWGVVLGAMSDEKVELKQMGKSYDFEDSPFTPFDGFEWGASPFQAANPDIHIRHRTLCDGTPDRRW